MNFSCFLVTIYNYERKHYEICFYEQIPCFLLHLGRDLFSPLILWFLQRENFANTQTRSLNYADGHPASRISGYCFQNPARYLITGRIIRPFISVIRLDSQAAGRFSAGRLSMLRKYKFYLQKFSAATNNCCWKVWFVNFFNRSNTQKAIVQ